MNVENHASAGRETAATSRPALSVVIPTHNRPEMLAGLVADLRRQSLAADRYEVIVVDDGSTPRVVLPEAEAGPAMKLVRLGGGERSAARNAGAAVAGGNLLVFLDDDMSVNEAFLANYHRAAESQPEAMLVGESVLPPEVLRTPFGRFRHERLESFDRRAPVPANFCAAGNMAIPAALFRRLGGFGAEIASGEDQDLALRHSALGGPIVFVPEARALHRDQATDIRSYCRRVLWGSEYLIPFCQRYPTWPANVERARINGFFDRRHDSLGDGLRKFGKSLLGLRPVTELLFRATSLLERFAHGGKTLERAYAVLVGLHFFRGYRRGLKRFGDVPRPHDFTARTAGRRHAAQ